MAKHRTNACVVPFCACGQRAPGPARRNNLCSDCERPQCEVCGHRFKRKNNKGKQQRTCSRACGRWLNTPGQIGATSSVPWRTCRHCDRPITQRIYCSADCQRSAHEARYKTWLETKHKPLLPTECKECGQTFTPARAARQGAFRTVFCSKPCADRFLNRESRHRMRTNRHARARASTGEHVGLMTIAKRDGWRCHICGKRVTKANWSMDHLVPLSHGGLHERRNVALAHALCNAIRSDRGQAQLLLIG